MTFLGLQAGRVFVNNRSLLTTALSGGDKWRAVGAHVVRWVLWGLVLGAIGGGLAGFSKDDGLIPINKNLWSPSFVLCMASIGFLALALFFVSSGSAFCDLNAYCRRTYSTLESYPSGIPQFSITRVTLLFFLGTFVL